MPYYKVFIRKVDILISAWVEHNKLMKVYKEGIWNRPNVKGCPFLVFNDLKAAKKWASLNVHEGAEIWEIDVKNPKICNWVFPTGFNLSYVNIRDIQDFWYGCSYYQYHYIAPENTYTTFFVKLRKKVA